MNYLIPLFLSAISTNGVHGYLLASLKTNRKWTISEHAVLHKKAFLLYVLGHILGGGFFLVFAKLYFVNVVHMQWLFSLSIFTVLFEYIQALLPARGKTNRPHTATALIMWGSFISLGLVSILFLPAALIAKFLATIVYIALLTTLVYGYFHRERTYKFQMIMVLLFYFSMFVLVV